MTQENSDPDCKIFGSTCDGPSKCRPSRVRAWAWTWWALVAAAKAVSKAVVPVGKFMEMDYFILKPWIIMVINGDWWTILYWHRFVDGWWWMVSNGLMSIFMDYFVTELWKLNSFLLPGCRKWTIHWLFSGTSGHYFGDAPFLLSTELIWIVDVLL